MLTQRMGSSFATFKTSLLATPMPGRSRSGERLTLSSLPPFSRSEVWQERCCPPEVPVESKVAEFDSWLAQASISYGHRTFNLVGPASAADGATRVSLAQAAERLVADRDLASRMCNDCGAPPQKGHGAPEYPAQDCARR